MSKKLKALAERLILISQHAQESEVFDCMITALDSKMHVLGVTKEKDLYTDIRLRVEQEYSLEPGSLINSFNLKKRHLTDPKLVWVNLCLHFAHGDRMKVLRMVDNGLTYQKIYMCSKEFGELNSKIPHHKSILEKYQNIIKTYE